MSKRNKYVILNSKLKIKKDQKKTWQPYQDSGPTSLSEGSQPQGPRETMMRVVHDRPL